MSECARGPCARGSREEEGVRGVVRTSTGGGSEASRDQEKPPEGLSWGETGSDCCSQGFCCISKQLGPGQPAGTQAEGRGEDGQDPHAAL